MLNFLGGNFLPPILQICLQKMDRFYWFFPKRPAEMPFKTLTYDWTSGLNDEVSREKVHLMSKCWCPNKFAKKRPELGKTAFFWFLSWDTAAIEMRCTFSRGNWPFTAELQTLVRFFGEMSNWPRYGGLISVFWGKRDQKLGNGISKRGQKTAPNFLNNCFGSKIKRRSWFCHQIWPNSKIWSSYGRLKLNV